MAQFIQEIRQRPLSERVEQGFTWYPLNIIQTGFAIGEKVFVLAERSTRLNEPHQLRAGQSVSLFCNQEHLKNPDKQGVINYVERNRIKIILNAREAPDWLQLGLVGVDMLFDDRSYQEMEKALHAVMKAKGNRLAELRQLLTPRPGAQTGAYSLKAGQMQEASDNTSLQHLNLAQQRAVEACLRQSPVTIIHGPPGTGKTTTLVAVVRELCRRESSVLVTAPSNAAADLLTERLAEAGLDVVRIGNISRVDDHILQHTLDARLGAHPESKNIKRVKIEAAELRRQANRYKRSFGYEERREREHLRQQARELEAWANTLEDRLLDQVLSNAQAVVSTLVGASHPILDKRTFPTCVIDEAAQALEPAAWIPILRSSKVILAGDPFQLPPTVKSIEAARGGLAETLIERCIHLLPEAVHLLDVQYRMHHAIMGFSNQYFYNGALQAHHSVGDRRLFSFDQHGETMTFFEPVVFVDTAGTGFEERQRSSGNTGRSLSKYNPEEALLVREHLLQLLQHFPEGKVPGIGILSPYREQVNEIDQMVRDDERLSTLIQKRDRQAAEPAARGALSINTIDGFQGQERDVVYISLVRSNSKHEIGFLSDYRRMNVAMTRARMLLVVIGDSATIGNNKFYQAFLDYCAEHGRYQTAWEYLK